MAVYGCIWLYMAVYGCAWLYMAVYGWIWLYMAVCGCIWLYMAVYMANTSVGLQISANQRRFFDDFTTLICVDLHVFYHVCLMVGWL